MKFRWFVAALFGAFICSATPALAHADDGVWHPVDEGIYTITIANDGNALDVAGGSAQPGANVGLHSSNQTAAQKWNVTYEPDGTARLTSLCSGLALAADGVGASANIVQQTYDGSLGQRWTIEVEDDGAYQLISAADNGLALTATGANAALNTAHANSFQRLDFESVAPIVDGVYRIACGTTGMVFDVANGSTSQGANIQIYNSNQTLAQKWYVSRGDDGAYTIESLCSGLTLTADGAGSGANVCQRPSGTLSRFYVEPAAGGSFSLRLKGTGNVVDVSGGVFASGRTVQLYEANQTAAQQFRFESCAPLADGYYTIAPVDNLSTRWDVSGASISVDANLWLWETNDGYAQTFDIKSTDSGIYEIRQCGVDRVIAPKNGSAAAGANIEVASPQNSNNQRWRFVYENGGFSIVAAASGLKAEVAGGRATSNANMQIALPTQSSAQRFRLFASAYIEPPVYHGFQNPSGYYQVSDQSVWFPHVGEGMFGYRTESRLSKTATKNDCIETMIGRAYEYLGTPYRWDYACAPGVGVDCAGLVLQALYATGMDLSPMNPWDHYYTPGHDHYAVWMANSSGFKHVSFGERQRGDLIFYSGHVAIYLGNDTIIEGTGPGVIISSIYRPGTIIGVGRVYI